MNLLNNVFIEHKYDPSAVLDNPFETSIQELLTNVAASKLYYFDSVKDFDFGYGDTSTLLFQYPIPDKGVTLFFDCAGLWEDISKAMIILLPNAHEAVDYSVSVAFYVPTSNAEELGEDDVIEYGWKFLPIAAYMKHSQSVMTPITYFNYDTERNIKTYGVPTVISMANAIKLANNFFILQHDKGFKEVEILTDDTVNTYYTLVKETSASIEGITDEQDSAVQSE